MKHNPENERIKRKYFAYLKEAKRHSEPTVDAAAKALSRFEEYTRYRAFKAFHVEQAMAFKRHLAEQTGERSREKLSKATLYATLTQLKKFFQWLAWQPGYKSRFQYSDADYFNLSDKEARIATAHTKFSKTFTTFFFPVSEEIRGIVADWVSYLRGDKLWGNDDPLFPATQVALGVTRQFEVSGLDRRHWSSATPIRAVFREAFVHAGLPYFHPHSFRNTLVRLGLDVCKTPEEFKAWSQNLGHEGILTTFLSYGEVPCDRQGEIIRALATPQHGVQSDENRIAEAVFRRFHDSGVNWSPGRQ